MSLPSGAIRLEYIESTGTQHIDTELITQSEKLRVECEFRYTAAHASTTLFGNQKGTSWPYAFSFTLYGAGPNIYVGASSPAASIATEVGKTHRLVLEADNGALTITLDGTITRGTYSGSLNHTLSTALFGNNKNGSVSQKCSARIKKWRAFDNGLLVRDFIPVKLSDGSVGLWDDVEGKFYGNAGTGAFVAGPAAEFVELEYIESSGTQYADTGFKPSSNSRVVMDVDASSSGNVKFLLGARTSLESDDRFLVVINSTTAFRSDYAASSANATATPKSGRQIVNANKNVVKFGSGTITHNAHTFTSSYPLFLLTCNSGGTASTAMVEAKIYSCQIYDNGLLVRDYIPAKTIEGEVGLYDRVFKEFYRNAGTGEFTAGPEMVHEDYTELEYIESNGAQYADTLFKPNNNTRIDIKAVVVKWTTTAVLFGSRNAANSAMFYMLVGNNNLKAYYNNVSSRSFDMTVGAENTISMNKETVEVNGESGSYTNASFQCSYSMLLFGLKTAETIHYLGQYRVMSCDIYDNGTEVRIYIPKLHPSGVAGLWDAVNERFYASATTTDLIAGPVKVTTPKAPGNFRVVSESDTEVALAWDASENAVGYRLYRDGVLLADTTELAYTDPAELFGAYTYTVRAYNEYGEGEAAELVVILSPDNPLLWLVTDRTQEDVTARNSKGVYTAVDLNRVGAAVDFLKGLLESAGHTVNVFPRADWSALDWMNTEEAARYLADVSEIRRKLSVPSSTPQTPDSMERLTFTKANHIEQILLDVYAQYLIMLTTRVAAGTATSGGDYL